MKAQTDHIKACYRAWLMHTDGCASCYSVRFGVDRTVCEQGRVLYDEYCQAIELEASRSGEQLTATEVVCDSLTLK